MKAIVYHDYGSADVLKYEEVRKPTPKDDEVLIKVRAASVNPLDWRMMKGKPRALRIVPRLLKMPIGRPGVDVAGEVEAVGGKVTQFKPGDAVFGGTRGAFAEYTCAARLHHPGGSTNLQRVLGLAVPTQRVAYRARRASRARHEYADSPCGSAS